MARFHGKECRAYLGEKDISGDVVTATAKLTAEVHDASVLGTAYVCGEPGRLGAEVTLDCLHDPAAGGIGRKFETILGAIYGSILSIYLGDADAVGDNGILFPDATLSERNQPMTAADMVKLTGTLKVNGRVGLNAKLLHALAACEVTTSFDGLDNGASSASGGRASVHMTAITGTWNIVIEHSDDNAVGDPYAALQSWNGQTGVGALTAEVTGTVKRWLRITATEAVAGTITFVAGFARY